MAVLDKIVEQMSLARQLRERFWNSFDPTIVIDAISRSKGRLPVAGEGRHFRAYELTRPGKPTLCIKEYRGDPTSPAFHQWRQLIEKISRQQLPLIPPMEFVRAAGFDVPFLVMPFGEQMESSARHRLTLDHTRTELRQLGLELHDYPQLASTAGIPFLIDFSDVARQS